MSTKEVNPNALNSFDKKHVAYDQLRPDFDPKVVDRFLGSLDLKAGGGLFQNFNSEAYTDKKILELAAGTGKFTRRLVDYGWKGDNLIVVEPSEGMLTTFRKNFPEVKALQGSSYSIPVPDNSVDVVIVAQGFHWFSDEESLKEIKRVLKKDGYFGCIWNLDGISEAVEPYFDQKTGETIQAKSIYKITEGIDDDINEVDSYEFAKEVFSLHEWSNEVAQLLYSYDTKVPQYRTGKWRSAIHESDHFQNISTEILFFTPNYIKADLVFPYWETRSYISERSQEEKDSIKKKIEDILQKSVTKNDKTGSGSDEKLIRIMGTNTIAVKPK